jgi:protein-S-isoprenylcysteine O-methyltransferase Ste14
MKKDNILFIIGGFICSICMILFVVALLFDNNQPTDPNEDWIGITYTIICFIGIVLFLIGAIIGPSHTKTNKS